MLWICKDCTCAYSVDAPSCPECGSTEYAAQGSADDPAVIEAAAVDDGAPGVDVEADGDAEEEEINA
jgi:hypothetical protein